MTRDLAALKTNREALRHGTGDRLHSRAYALEEASSQSGSALPSRRCAMYGVFVADPDLRHPPDTSLIVTRGLAQAADDW